MAFVVTGTKTCYLVRRVEDNGIYRPTHDNILQDFVYRTLAMSTFILKFDNGDYPNLIDWSKQR